MKVPPHLFRYTLTRLLIAAAMIAVTWHLTRKQFESKVIDSELNAYQNSASQAAQQNSFRNTNEILSDSIETVSLDLISEVAFTNPDLMTLSMRQVSAESGSSDCRMICLAGGYESLTRTLMRFEESGFALRSVRMFIDETKDKGAKRLLMEIIVSER